MKNFKLYKVTIIDYFLIILVKVKYFLKFNSKPKTGSNIQTCDF